MKIVIFWLLWVLATWSACAETKIDERLLGLTEPALINVVPGIKRLSKPSYGPHGSRGILSLAHDELNFEVTFYFRRNRLARIEQRRRSPEIQCDDSYAALIASLAARYGPGIYSDAGNNASLGQGQSAAWVSESFRVMAYRVPSANQCDLLVAFEPHEHIDARDL